MRSGGGRPSENGRRGDGVEAAFASTLGAARRGDPCALERIYRHYSPRVAGYLRTHGVSDVGGATNDVFLRAFPRLAGFDGDETGFRS